MSESHDADALQTRERIVKPKLPRILNIDEPDGWIDVVCDPEMPPELVLDWLMEDGPGRVMEARKNLGYGKGWDDSRVITGFTEIRHGGWHRWLPMQYEDYTHMLWPAKGPGRGAFFVRFFEVKWEGE